MLTLQPENHAIGAAFYRCVLFFSFVFDCFLAFHQLPNFHYYILLMYIYFYSLSPFNFFYFYLILNFSFFSFVSSLIPFIPLISFRFFFFSLNLFSIYFISVAFNYFYARHLCWFLVLLLLLLIRCIFMRIDSIIFH